MGFSSCFLSIKRLFLVVAIGGAGFFSLVSLKGAPITAAAFDRTLTFEERVDYQRKIEEVYWRHRIWPKERTDSKPALEAVMSHGQIEEKVRSYVRNSRVLEDYWQQPISFQELQAEMDRMARQTKNPDMLRELFAALGNDLFVIAECLARPALSEQLANQFYEMKPPSGGATRLGVAGVRSRNVPAFTGYSLPALGGIPSGTCIDDTWSALADLPARRATHTAVWTGSEMIVWGGSNYDLPIGTGDRYNPATDSWSKVSLTNAPTARYRHTAVWTGTEMIIWGGADPGFFLSSGGKYNPANDTWTPTSLSNAPTPRFFHTAVWTGTEMIVWGGTDATSPITGGRYDPSTDSWQAMSTANAPEGRIEHTALWTGSEMVVWGGRSCDTCYLKSGAKYNPVSDTWTSTNTVSAPVARTAQGAVWTGSEMLVWGGWNGAFVGDGAKYNPAADSWVGLSASNPPAARQSPVAVWTGTEMILWGGIVDGQSGAPANSGSRYNPVTNIWSPMNTSNAPFQGATNTAVWTGSEMIVFGGGYGETLNDGGRYNPTADSWTPVPTTNNPAGRYEHQTVWTGSEMIVWGGQLNNVLTTNSGGRYDPALDRWTPTSTLNAPERRESHTAVWTGTEMIVWGGWGPDPFRILNTGGRYAPATDTWTSTTLTNAPAPRRWHSAAWTGNEMIVWGGELGGGSGFTNTGGRYNPSTDSWIATGTANAPGSRKYHTAIWTGTEMLVWGGVFLSSGPTNTGGRYNPVDDSWAATSTIGTAARNRHTAVWTGEEMIVWGGSAAGPSENGGARYDPRTNTWASTSLFNAPAGRGSHAAIWTGDEMIVWGGNGLHQDPYLNTGGRYRPKTDSWIPITTINAPLGVELPTAVWTGDRMIVWGGYFSYYDPLHHFHAFVASTGGQYCPGSGLPPGTLANIATRAFVQTGDNAMIGGLIVTGTGPKKVILRAIGPSLSNLGITDALPDPVLELHDSTGAVLASSDNWGDAPNKQAIIDSGLAPGHNLEAAILTNLNPGAYTAVLRGANMGTGTAVVEAYDLEQTASSKLGNISTRAFVQTGDRVLIGGLIVTGSGPEVVVVRAIGPSLAQVGVANALADPVLELRDSNGSLRASNDNWIDAANKQAIIDSGLEPRHNLESAILTSVSPGSYTAIVRGVQNGTGVALVEVFGLDH
ncbi:MAG TPA: hypothetical protein VJU77_09935 [Chthoniobacterales bacterium]|nr:hypothetical protein [Chthoniobacterales bacterium]